MQQIFQMCFPLLIKDVKVLQGYLLIFAQLLCLKLYLFAINEIYFKLLFLNDRPMIYTERPSSATLKSTTSTTTTITTSTSTTSSQIASLPQNVSCLRMNLNLTHPQTSIVASLGNGRLGNQLSNFASCFAIWKEYGMYPYLDSMQLGLIEKVFDLPKLEDTNNASYHLWNKGKYIRSTKK